MDYFPNVISLFFIFSSPMQFGEIIKKNGTKIKYGMVICLFCVMIFSIERYTNYLEIIKTTDNINKKTQLLKNEFDYVNNFELKYLASDYGHFFLAHKNNSIFWWENIISFKENIPENSVEEVTLSHLSTQTEIKDNLQDNKELSPEDAWIQFLKNQI